MLVLRVALGVKEAAVMLRLALVDAESDKVPRVPDIERLPDWAIVRNDKLFVFDFCESDNSFDSVSDFVRAAVELPDTEPERAPGLGVLRERECDSVIVGRDCVLTVDPLFVCVAVDPSKDDEREMDELPDLDLVSVPSVMVGELADSDLSRVEVTLFVRERPPIDGVRRDAESDLSDDTDAVLEDSKE